MKVAIFTDNDFERVSGVTTTLRAVVQQAPRGISVRVYTAASLATEEPHYLALESIGLPISFAGAARLYLPRLRAFLRQARRDQVDVVHLTTPGPIGLAGMWVAAKLRVPIVGSVHSDLSAYASVLSGSARLGAMMDRYLRWTYGHCSRVLVPSQATQRLLAGAVLDSDRIRVWPRGVDSTAFTPARRSRALRESWHVDDRRPALLHVGRLAREKGLDLLPEIHDTLHAMGAEHRFIFAGDGPYADVLRERMPDAVFTGVLPQRVLASVIASADVLVFPSRTDTAGNIVLEAQASGLPVVVSDAGGPQENIVAGVTGLVCQGDAAAWAAHIAPLLRSATLRSTLGDAARQYAVTRRWDVALEPLFQCYGEVMTATALHPTLRRVVMPN